MFLNTLIGTLMISIHLSTALNKETIVSIDDKDKTQYHEVNFDTRSYNFGYEVGTNRQFHHEIRGSDGVTYGCFGYFDQDDKLLMTHYVADAHGYRLIESNKPVKIYPVVTDTKPALEKNENVIDSRNTMVLTEWKDLFLPRGCRMMESGNINFANSGNNQIIEDQNSENEGKLKTISTIPHPGIGTHTSHFPSKPISGSISGTLTSAHGISHGVGSSHGTTSTPQHTNNQSTQQQQANHPGFNIGGQFTGTHGTQGSFQIGLTKPPLNHGHNHSSSHSHGHIIGSHLHTTKKPGHFEHGGSFSHGNFSAGHHISHGHGQTNSTKPTSSHIQHGGSFSHGSTSGNHQGSITWGNHGQTTSHKPSIITTKSTKKPSSGSIEHGGSFSHGSISGSHQGGISWGNQGQTTTTKIPNHGGGSSSQGSYNGQNGYHYQHQGQYQYQGNYNNEGYYGGSYVHQPVPTYQHIHSGQGQNGDYNQNGGYGNNANNNHGHNQGGYHHTSDPNNPDSNCNEPNHHHQTSQHPGPFYTKTSTSRRPNTDYSTTTSYKPRPTTSRPQTYPTRPTSTPNPTGDDNSQNLGVQPPSTRPPNYGGSNQPSQQQQQQPQPLFFIPYPFPFAPTCPCYYMHNNNHSAQFQHGNVNGQIQWQSQPQFHNIFQPYAIGLIPVLFVPHCMQTENYNIANIPGQYLQVPYSCAQCNTNNRDARELNEEFSSSDSFKQVLEQAGVSTLDNTFLIKSQPRKLRMRKMKRVQKVEQENEDEEKSKNALSQ